MQDIHRYNEKTSSIDKIEFTVFGNKEILNMSVLGRDTPGLIVPDLYDNTEPTKGGLIDQRMGITDNHLECYTCGLGTNYCVGHFGHMKLEEKVYHMGYLDTVVKILNCICVRCSKLLVYKNELDIIDILKNKKGKNRLTEFRNLVKNVTYCIKGNYGCGAPVPKIKSDKKKSTAIINIVAEYVNNIVTEDNPDKKPIKEILTPERVYQILKNISDQDCYVLGFDPKKNRPEDFIHSVFPVPPVQVRPSVRGDFLASTTREDHLTIKLSDILKANLRIQKHKETNNENMLKYFQDHVNYLQYHVATYYDNESLSLPQSEQKGMVTKSLSSRLKSKEGRIRNNLMGKRTDFSGRTVITPDPMLSVNELGMPIQIARNITFPEIVTPYNIEYLSRLVRNGRDEYPGANFVIPIGSNNSQSRNPIDLRFRKERIELRFGDIVERHIQTGDIVLLNRQPTLHKQSMMGHKIKVIDNTSYSTFRLNPNCTKPYNADFDGDEMNTFFCQSVQSQVELEEIADVKLQIITPQSSSPIIGIVQDGLVGGYCLTINNDPIDWRTVMNILSITEFDDWDRIKKYKDYNGKEIFSQIIPKRINMFKGDSENVVISIKNGVMIEGYLSLDTIGVKSKNNLIQLIWDEYGCDETKKFIDNTTRFITLFNLYYGFTVGIGDIDISEELIKMMYQLFQTKKLEVCHEITELENNPDMMDEELFEKTISQKLNVILQDVSKLIMSNLKPTNNFKIMIESGSKGKAINMGQIGGCVGQQDFQGGRILKNYNDRTLPYFFKNDDRAEARGFCERSFAQGQTLHEFIFHTLTSREGVIDTAVKTSESGYIQRKLIKSTEDFMIKYDCTVRNAVERIQQFIYGDNGIDTTRQYQYNMKFVELSNSEMVEKYKFTKEELSKLKNFNEKDNEKMYIQMLNVRDHIRHTQVKATMNYITLNTIYMLPVNIMRIIDNIRNYQIDNKKVIDDPNYIMDKINFIIDNNNTKLYSMTNEELKNSKSFKSNDSYLSKTAFKYALLDTLNPKKCIINYKLSKEQIDDITVQIIKSFNKAVVEPGEMIGIIAAQSLGEPVTQMTLNTFHTSGVAAIGGANLGVPRLKEVFSLSKNLKEPLMIIYFDKEHNNKKDFANKIASYIKFTTIKDLRTKIEIYYDPQPYKKDGFMDKDNVYNIFYSYQQNKNCCQNTIDGLNWLMRIEFDKEKLLTKEVTLLDIKSSFCQAWVKRYLDIKTLKREKRQILEKITQLAVLSNTDNDDIPTIHIRFDMNNFNSATLVDFMDLFVDEFKLKGIEDIVDIRGGNAIEARMISFDEIDKKLEKNSEYVIYTKGINMASIRNIIGVDLNRTYCNDIITTYEIFGIEAARNMIIREIISVFTANGSTVNFQHVSVFGDLMTNVGTLTSIDRHGLNKLDTDPFSRASFERPVEQLINAAIFNEVDYMKSVSSRIMAGLCIKGGTGLCNLILDKDLLENSEYTIDVGQLYKKTYNDISSKSNIEIDENVFIPEI